MRKSRPQTAIRRETAMSSIQYLRIGLLALVFMGGCESTPTVTRTGDVKDIVIGDRLSAAEVSLNPGDEVRWNSQSDSRRPELRFVPRRDLWLGKR